MAIWSRNCPFVVSLQGNENGDPPFLLVFTGYGYKKYIWRRKKICWVEVTTLTTRDCKGPQTNMPKNVLGSIKTWSAKIILLYMSTFRRSCIFFDKNDVKCPIWKHSINGPCFKLLPGSSNWKSLYWKIIAQINKRALDFSIFHSFFLYENDFWRLFQLRTFRAQLGKKHLE